MDQIATKECKACGLTKPTAEFYRNNQHSDGLTTYCKICHRAKIMASYVPHPREKQPEGFKWCPRCEVSKPVDDFGYNRAQHDGRQNYCKKCSVALVTASRHKDPTSHRASSKRWREKNLERHKDNNLRHFYGIEPGTYDRMAAAQEGKCAICQTTEPGGNATRFHVDHCHDTGAIRGLLCNSCNNGIGRFRHDPALLKAAIEYLTRQR